MLDYIKIIWQDLHGNMGAGLERRELQLERLGELSLLRNSEELVATASMEDLANVFAVDICLLHLL